MHKDRHASADERSRPVNNHVANTSILLRSDIICCWCCNLVLSGIRFNIDCSKDTIPITTVSTLKKQIEDPAASIMVLSRGLERNSTEVFGYMYCFDEIKSGSPSCYIAEVFIERSMRGKGLGELLMIANLANG
jgi:hypothetical protein